MALPKMDGKGKRIRCARADCDNPVVDGNRTCDGCWEDVKFRSEILRRQTMDDQLITQLYV